MKNSIIIFLFLSIVQLLNAQVDTVNFGSAFIFNYNNHILIEGCDTFKVAVNFSSPISNTSSSFFITKSGGVDEEDYWPNLSDTIWITEDNPIWNLNIFPYQDNIEEGEECILFKIESVTGYRNVLRLKIIDEFPQYSLEIDSGWENDFICSEDTYVTIDILPEVIPPTYEDLSYSINGQSFLFVDDTITNVYIDVSGVGDCYFFKDVFDKICFSVNFLHTENMKVSLKSPDDKQVVLYDGEVASTVMTETCFDFSSSMQIEEGGPVYFGTFEPSGSWDDIMNAELNGVWTLIFETDIDISELQGHCAYGRLFFEVLEHSKFSYQCDWYSDTQSHGQFNFWEEDEFGQHLEPGELSLQVHALNCSYDLETTIYQSGIESLDTAICRNASFLWNGHNMKYPREYEAVFFENLSENGCDSISEISVDYLPVNYDINLEVLVQGETTMFDGSSISEYGSYSALYENQYGCDSSLFLTILPPEAFVVVDNIPDEISQTLSSGCEAGVCLPFYADNYGDFDYFVDGEKIENFDISTCEASVELRSFFLSGEFSSDMHHYISELIIDGISYPSFGVKNTQQFLNTLNYYVPDLALISPNGLRIYARREFHLSYTINSLLGEGQSAYSGTIGSTSILNTGIFIPLSVGTHELQIKHRYLDVQKTVSVTLGNHVYPVVDTINLVYFGELDQRVNFPLPSNALCGEIVSAVEDCSNVSSSIVDFTLSNQGLLSFKPLIPKSFSLCIKICDDKNVCQIVVLKVNFEEEDDFFLRRNIFPNPAQNKVSLTDEDNFKIEKVVVHDALGRQVEILNFEPESSVEIDTSRYPEGVYFLTVHINGENYLHKLLIQR